MFYYSVFLSSSLESLYDGEVASWIEENTLEVTVDGPGPWYWTVITWDNSEESTGANAVFSFRSNLDPTIAPILDQEFAEGPNPVGQCAGGGSGRQPGVGKRLLLQRAACRVA
jgi:hypothetical protein